MLLFFIYVNYVSLLHFFYFYTVVTDVSCHLSECVSDQHENLCHFGHWAHLILATYCYVFLFLSDVISVILLML